nr:RNA-directed DNA polymerase, eukaryota [Tanacetum cinerariifolium]
MNELALNLLTRVSGLSWGRWGEVVGVMGMVEREQERRDEVVADQKRDLEGEVTNDEIKKAVWDCGTDKAPGPDGFTFGFYRKFCYLIDNDVYFRPISLVGSVYKIIAKILANRLVGILGDIVSEVQSAFIAGRQILDGPFIPNEVLQWCKIKKKQSLIFKVDFEKAYDSVRWDFLDENRANQLLLEENLRQSSLIDSFRRSPRGGAEQQQYIDLEDMVTATILAPMSDRLVCSLKSLGEFTVASVRKLIDDKWLPGADNKTRWIKYGPIKINVHAWKVMSDSIPTIFNISRRGISIDSLSCVLCDNGVETSNHLFFPVALFDKCLGSLCDGGTFLRLNLSRTLDGWIEEEERNPQPSKRAIQTDDAQTAWTTEEEIGWLKESGAGDEYYVQRAMIHYQDEIGSPLNFVIVGMF